MLGQWMLMAWEKIWNEYPACGANWSLIHDINLGLHETGIRDTDNRPLQHMDVFISFFFWVSNWRDKYVNRTTSPMGSFPPRKRKLLQFILNTRYKPTVLTCNWVRCTPSSRKSDFIPELSSKWTTLFALPAIGEWRLPNVHSFDRKISTSNYVCPTHAHTPPLAHKISLFAYFNRLFLTAGIGLWV